MNVVSLLFLLTKEYIVTIILSSILAVFIITTLTIFIYNRYLAKKNRETISHRYNMSQNIIVDFSSQTVKILSLKNLRKRNEMSYVNFLNTFDQLQQNDIKNWMQSLIEGNYSIEDDFNLLRVADAYIDIDNKKSLMKMLILCTHIDKENKTLFFESELLLNTPVSSSSKSNKTPRKEYKFCHPLSEIKKKYDDGDFNRGALVEIRISKKINVSTSYNDYFIKIILLDAIYKILSKNNSYFFFTNNETELCLLDDRSYSSYQLPKFINLIKEKISETFEIRGFINYFDFYIVSSLVSDLKETFDNSYNILEKYFTLDTDTKRKYTIFKTDREGHLDLEQSYKTEVTRIIRNQSIEVNFRPIIHIANKRVVNVGFMSFVKPVNTIFKDIDEIKKFAKMYDLDKDLFSLILRNIIPTFINEKENPTQKLAINICIDQIAYAIRSIPHFSGISNTYLILCFSSHELIDLEDNEDVIRGIKNLKDKGYELGLNLSANDYVLKRSTYAIFDYFFFDSKFSPNVKANSQDFLKAHQYLENLVKFNGTIVGVNNINMQSIELLVKSGIEYFSADCISPTSPMLLPIDRKISKKLLNMNK